MFNRLFLFLAGSGSIRRHRRVQSSTTEPSIASITHAEPLQVTEPVEQVTLQRNLGLFSGVCLIVGVIIGKFC